MPPRPVPLRPLRTGELHQPTRLGRRVQLGDPVEGHVTGEPHGPSSCSS
jgi:hypothetical protein